MASLLCGRPCPSVATRPAAVPAPLVASTSYLSAHIARPTVNRLAAPRESFWRLGGLGRGTAAAPATSNSASAAADLDDDDLESIGLGSSGSGAPEIDFPLPEVRYQQPLSSKERRFWKSKGEALAKDGKLLRCQVGQLGVTPAFLRSCSGMLQKNELVRVKLGDGCGLERKATAKALAEYLDAACVHQIGFTITLYRQKGLPRPSNLPGPENEGGRDNSEAIAAAEARAAAKAEAAAAKQDRKRQGQLPPGERPPEYAAV